MTRDALLHLALSAVYALTAAILFADAAYAHSGCAALAALIYALITWVARKGKSKSESGAGEPAP